MAFRQLVGAALACMAALLCVVCHAATMPYTVSGLDVNRVVYTHANGIGEFLQDSAGYWNERNPDGAFRFEERGRDHNAVQMYDPSRDTWIMLDISQGRILVKQGNSEYVAIYTIDASENVQSAAPPTVASVHPPGAAQQGSDAWNVVEVNFDLPFGYTLRYVQNADGRWSEYSPDGEFSLSEEARNESFVQLYDASRDQRVRLDTRRRIIALSHRGGPYTDTFGMTDIRTGQSEPPAQAVAATYGNPPNAYSIWVELYNPFPSPQWVYIDDPQQGLYAVNALPPAQTSGAYFDQGTRLVFGSEGGAAIGVYDVQNSVAHVIDISTVGGVGAPEQSSHVAAQPFTQPATQPSPTMHASEPASRPQMPPTRPFTHMDSATAWSVIAGRERDFVNDFGFPTRAFALDPMMKAVEIEGGETVTIYMRPQATAWLQNGQVYLSVDLTGSSASLAQYQDQDRIRGFFFDGLQQRFTLAGQGSPYDHYPKNGLGSTSVSTSAGWSLSLSLQGTFGPGVGGSYSSTGSTGQAFDDYTAKVTRDRAVTIDWRLCNAGQVTEGMPLNQCIYKGPASLDIGGGKLARLPASAYDFHALNAWTVFLVPFDPAQSTIDVSMDLSTNLRKTWFPGYAHDVLQVGKDVGGIFQGQVPKVVHDVARDIECAVDINRCRPPTEPESTVTRANLVVETVYTSRQFQYNVTFDISSLDRVGY